MLNTRITVREAIVKVSTQEWSRQKNGTLSIKNAERFGLFYGLDNFMNDLATENVRDFKHHCRTVLSYKHGTINRKLAALSKLCTYSRGVKGFQFTWGLPLIEYETENNKREFVVSKELESKLLMTARLNYRDDEADLWECLIFTGCRVSELLNLTWDKIKDGFLHLVDTKTGDDRFVPIFDEVEKILAKRKKMGLEKPFPLSIHAVEHAWRMVRKKLGMEHEKDFVMHSLRHTCITRLLKRKIGIEVVQKIVGHKDIRMTQRYNHPTKDDLKNAVSEVLNK
jgi:integrase